MSRAEPLPTAEAGAGKFQCAGGGRARSFEELFTSENIRMKQKDVVDG